METIKNIDVVLKNMEKSWKFNYRYKKSIVEWNIQYDNNLNFTNYSKQCYFKKNKCISHMYKFFVKDTRDQGQDSDYIWSGMGVIG